MISSYLRRLIQHLLENYLNEDFKGSTPFYTRQIFSRQKRLKLGVHGESIVHMLISTLSINTLINNTKLVYEGGSQA